MAYKLAAGYWFQANLLHRSTVSIISAVQCHLRYQSELTALDRSQGKTLLGAGRHMGNGMSAEVEKFMQRSLAAL
ncbi:hypothetical protein E4U19_002760 [Claviceps sp. Clav32 group G5]|nr:hypothetical protein E4U19_002760 [Claviceps sp. Clav32 group G5]KAG6041240.1 hypothetical protein E4U39_006656 [Claviceps sp. Clav50 group G5]